MLKFMRAGCLALVAMALVFGTFKTAAAADALTTLMAGGKPEYKASAWWTAGVDFRGPGCSDKESCTGALALRFNTQQAGKVGVEIFETPDVYHGWLPYLAASRGLRYPGDTNLKFTGRAWVTMKDNGFVWENGINLNCKFIGDDKADCRWQKLNTGWTINSVILYKVPFGPSPTAWPATN